MYILQKKTGGRDRGPVSPISIANHYALMVGWLCPGKATPYYLSIGPPNGKLFAYWDQTSQIY